MWFETLPSSPVVLALGWTLLHFLWQGTLIAASIAIALAAMKRRSASARYLVCCAGLAAMLVTPIVTLLVELRHDSVSSASLGLLSALDTGLLSRGDGLTRVLPAFVLVWLVGALAFGGRLLVHWLSARRLRHRDARPAPPRVQLMLAELADRLGVRRSVTALESGLAAVPAVMGWLRPVVLLPTGVLTGLTPQQLRAVLAHELAHVRRHDYVVNLLQSAIEALLFYHPATWWLGNRLRLLREYCCDDVSVELCGDAMCFARALSSLDELAADEPSGAPPSSAALGATGGSPMDRIRRLFGMPVTETQRPAAWAAPFVLTVALSGTAALAFPAQDALLEVREAPANQFVVKLPAAHDVVDLARSADERSGEILAKLRAAGASDDMLLAVLLELNPTSPEVNAAARKAMTHARNRQEKLAKKLSAVRTEIERAVASGALSPEQAAEKLATIERKVQAALQSSHQVRHDADVTHQQHLEHMHTLELLERRLAEETDPAHREAIEARLEHLRATLHEHMQKANTKLPFARHEAHGKHGDVELTEGHFGEARVEFLQQVGARLEQELAHVEAKLASTSDESVRAELEARAKGLRAHLEAARQERHGVLRRVELERAHEGHAPHEHGENTFVEATGDVVLHAGRLVETTARVPTPGEADQQVILQLVKGEMAARGLGVVEIDAAVQRIQKKQQLLLLREAAEGHEQVRQAMQVRADLDEQRLVEQLRQLNLTEEQIEAKLHQHLQAVEQKQLPRER